MGNPLPTHSLPKTCATEESQKAKSDKKCKELSANGVSLNRTMQKTHERKELVLDSAMKTTRFLDCTYEEVYDGHWPSSAAHPQHLDEVESSRFRDGLL